MNILAQNKLRATLNVCLINNHNGFPNSAGFLW